MSTQLQTLSGVHLTGAGGHVSGVVRAVAHPDQSIGDTTVSALPITSAIDATTGAWSLSLVCGIVYDVKIPGWGVHTITVTGEPARDFTAYLPPNEGLRGTLPGSIRTSTGEDIIPVVTGPDSDGNYSIGWQVAATGQDAGVNPPPLPSDVLVDVGGSGKKCTVAARYMGQDGDGNDLWQLEPESIQE